MHMLSCVAVCYCNSIAYMGPAVTTYQGLNLGFRIYTMDGDYDGTTNVSLIEQ